MKAYKNFTDEQLMEVATKAMSKVLIVLERFNERKKFEGNSGYEIFIDKLLSEAEREYNHEKTL